MKQLLATLILLHRLFRFILLHFMRTDRFMGVYFTIRCRRFFMRYDTIPLT